MNANNDEPDVDPERGERLKKIRWALGYRTQTAFAELVDVPMGTWNRWENGASIPIRKAGRLCDRLAELGLEVDEGYIYRGRMGMLRLNDAARLNSATEPASDPKPKA